MNEIKDVVSKGDSAIYVYIENTAISVKQMLYSLQLVRKSININKDSVWSCCYSICLNVRLIISDSKKR
jgi:hypothetical protein